MNDDQASRVQENGTFEDFSRVDDRVAECAHCHMIHPDGHMFCIEKESIKMFAILVFADVFEFLPVRFANQRRTNKKTTGDAKLMQDLPRAQTLLQPVVEAETDIGFVNSPGFHSVHCLGKADQLMVTA